MISTRKGAEPAVRAPSFSLEPQPVADSARRGPRGELIPWDQPSRFGPAGVAARRLLQRALRPYSVRQARVDEMLERRIELLEEEVRRLLQRESSARFGDLAEGLDTALVTEAITDVGTLHMHRHDRIVTPWLTRHGVWEVSLAGFLRRILRPGMTFVDVGANIGYFSVLASPIVGPRGWVAAVEAEPSNAALVRANLWRNGCRNASVFALAAYSRTGHAALAVEENATVFSRVDDLVGQGSLVPCARLDDLLGEGRPDVVKIDAEGSDRLVVEGMLGALERSPRAWVVVELLAHLDPASDLEAYRSMGFGLHALDEEGGTAPTTSERVLQELDSVTHMNLVMRWR